MKKGITYYKAKDYNTALNYMKQALDLKPGSYIIMHNIAYCYFKMEDYDNAKSYNQNALEILPDHDKSLKLQKKIKTQLDLQSIQNQSEELVIIDNIQNSNNINSNLNLQVVSFTNIEKKKKYIEPTKEEDYSFFRLKPWLGYGFTSMVDLNDQLNNYKSFLSLMMGPFYANYITQNEVEEITGGLIYGLDMMFYPSKNFGIGSRIGCIQPSAGTYTFELNFSDPMIGNEYIYEQLNISTSLIPILIGGKYSLDNEKFNFSIGLFGGFAMANLIMKDETRMIFDYTPFAESMGYVDETYENIAEIPGSGTDFCADLILEALYRINPHFHFGIEAGYFIATIKTITADKDVDMDNDGTIDVNKGDALTEVNNLGIGSGKDLAIDFSGLHISLVFKFLF
jgi:hypothetical protein